MSLERRKQHQYDAPPSQLGLHTHWHEFPPVLAVRSPGLRATAPTQDQICPEIPGRYARREEGIEGYRAQLATISDCMAHIGQLEGA